jgi:hypothetical protein
MLPELLTHLARRPREVIYDADRVVRHGPDGGGERCDE